MDRKQPPLCDHCKSRPAMSPMVANAVNGALHQKGIHVTVKGVGCLRCLRKLIIETLLADVAPCLGVVGFSVSLATCGCYDSGDHRELGWERITHVPDDLGPGVVPGAVYVQLREACDYPMADESSQDEPARAPS